MFVHSLLGVIFKPVSFCQLVIFAFANSSYLLSTQACYLTDLALFHLFQYPGACGPYKLSGIRDLTAGYDSTKPDNKPVSNYSCSTHVALPCPATVSNIF